jgi:hypothetical protein
VPPRGTTSQSQRQKTILNVGNVVCGGDDFDNANTHITWASGKCEDDHNSCFADAGLAIDDVRQAASANDLKAVDGILRRYSTSVRYNADRQVLQVSDCTGGVVAQFRVSESVGTFLH